MNGKYIPQDLAGYSIKNIFYTYLYIYDNIFKTLKHIITERDTQQKQVTRENSD